MADCTELFPFYGMRRDKTSLQLAGFYGLSTPTFYRFLVYNSEIVAEKWCGKLAFKKKILKRKVTGCVYRRLILPL